MVKCGYSLLIESINMEYSHLFNYRTLATLTSTLGRKKWQVTMSFSRHMGKYFDGRKKVNRREKNNPTKFLPRSSSLWVARYAILSCLMSASIFLLSFFASSSWLLPKQPIAPEVQSRGKPSSISCYSTYTQPASSLNLPEIKLPSRLETATRPAGLESKKRTTIGACARVW